ncbi:MAG: BON domain-containing protein [Sphingomonadaceae bacterium]
MGIRRSTLLAWLGATVALAVAALALTSPRARQQLSKGTGQLLDATSRGIRSLRSRMQGQFGRQMAALQEVSETFDAATAQYEASMVVSKVSSAIASEPNLRGRKVGVRMIGGILHLEGEVRTPEEKALASEIARRASGAELVANDLKVAATTV